MTNPQTLPPPPAGVTFADEPVASQTQQTAPASLPPPPAGVQFVDEPQMTSPNAADQGFQTASTPQALPSDTVEQDNPLNHGAIRSFYDSTLAPLLKTAGGLIQHSGNYDPDNPLLQAIVNQVNSTSEHGQKAIDILKSIPAGASLSDAWKVINKQGQAANELLYATPLIGSTIEGMDQKWARGNYAGALGDVAGLAANLMAPELIKGAKAGLTGTKSAIGSTLKSGSPSAAAKAADQLGVEISPGRASNGLPRMAEANLRSTPETSGAAEAADLRTNQGIKAVGMRIADSILNTDLSLEEQGTQIQNSLNAARKTAGQEVGAVHDAITSLGNPPDIKASNLVPLAQKFVDELSITDPNWKGLETAENRQAAEFIDNFTQATKTSPAFTSSILDASGNPIVTPASTVPKPLDFDTAGKILNNINDLIPNVPNKAGGALKQMASAIKEQMYEVLPDDLASRLKATHERFASVVNNLENGIGAKIVGTRLKPTPPELVGNYLSKASSVDVGNLRNLLGPERIPQVQRSLLQNVLEGTADNNGGVLAGNNLYANWNKISDSAKALYSPEQLSAIDDYVKAVQDINLDGPKKLPGNFAPRKNDLLITNPHVMGANLVAMAIHPAAGFAGLAITIGRDVAVTLTSRRLSQMLLEPVVARDLTKALSTTAADRGANQLGQRLLFAAHQSAVRDRQADASATTPQ